MAGVPIRKCTDTQGITHMKTEAKRVYSYAATSQTTWGYQRQEGSSSGGSDETCVLPIP